MILVDTGPVVAALNRRDPDHLRCRKLLDDGAGQLLVTPYVVAEVCWMAASRLGARAEANVIDAVAAGDFRQVAVEDADLARISELLHQYADLHGGDGLSVADASVVAAAERLNISDIATLDITDFSIVRPRHIDHFTLL
ncbi:type II toxin-antitoxin system VapC family toxin [Streptomyces sp. TRM68367]|uniref:type II toxin-antitoxin system VapC family toxin n=1 Tax=Streptomyces sp. TRM68367 TaxID=2758415 RepID=UPI00165C450D|nr:PIN domain-containing protein [Streptomyces sp. TRM68367]MBC9731297.1 PIN domain-containing protein [Streptomyces sp. TRM68367]